MLSFLHWSYISFLSPLQKPDSLVLYFRFHLYCVMEMRATTHTSITSMVVVVFMVVLMAMSPAASAARKEVVLKYYTQQQQGVNEFGTVSASVPPVNGTRAGVGLELVYGYTVTETGDPSSQVLGYVRGTSVVASNTLAATVYVVNTVVHYADPKEGGLNGTFTTQGEANFGTGAFELAVTGGTGDFRGVFGYTTAVNFRFIPPTANSTAKVTNFYRTDLWWA